MDVFAETALQASDEIAVMVGLFKQVAGTAGASLQPEHPGPLIARTPVLGSLPNSRKQDIEQGRRHYHGPPQSD
jgi:hypothetical protein